MNPFYIIWLALFASYSSSQNESSSFAFNPGSEHEIRCDTYTQVHKIHYTWSIHQFSVQETLDTNEILSPKLHSPTTDKYEWNIAIVFDDIDDGNEIIGVWVCLTDESIIKEAFADINVAIIDHKQETLFDRNQTSTKYFAGECHGWRVYCEKNDLFSLLQNDTLTLSINIRWHQLSHDIVHDPHQNANNLSDPNPGTIIKKCNLLENLGWVLESPKLADLIFSTNGADCRCDQHTGMLQVHEIKYTWAIHNFSVHETFDCSEISSPNLYTSTTDRYAWHITVLLNGNDRNNNYLGVSKSSIAMDVHLSSQSKAKSTLAKFETSVLNLEKQVDILCHEKWPVERSYAGGYQHWQVICIKNSWFKENNINNDTLNLFIRIKWLSELRNNMNISHPHINNTSSPAPTSDPTDAKCNLSQVLKSMLEKPKFADVVFTTNQSSYPAHKAVLAARSRVFSTMFQQKVSKNRKLKKVRINVAPMSEEALQAMLQYIYTEKCENLDKLADKLFIAAVKYGLDGLRHICEQTLCNTVSTENALSMLEFAQKHHANQLEAKAMEFIKNTLQQKSNATTH